MPKPKISGQSLSEFALILAVVAGVISGMQIYVQRGLQARYKNGMNYVISRIEEGARVENITGLSNISRQYEPYYREFFNSVSANSKDTIGFPRAIVNETTSRSGWERVNSADKAD